MRRKYTDPIYFVYLFFRPNGMPCYVGLGTRKRIEKHFSHRTNVHLNRIIAKAGGSLPVVKIREGLFFEQAAETEIALIKAIGRECDGGPLVNITLGGEGVPGLIHSEATCKKISAIQTGRPGRPLSEAGKRSISEKNTGRVHTEESRRHMSEGQKARDPAVVARMAVAQKIAMQRPETREKCRQAKLGTKASEATKAKLSARMRGKKRSAEVRANMSAAAKIRGMSDACRAANNRKGSKHTPEVCARISEALRHRGPISDETRAKLCAARRRTVAAKHALKEAA